MQKSAFQEQKLAAYDTRQARPTTIIALLSLCASENGLTRSAFCAAQNAYQNGWKTSLTGAIAADCPCEAQHRSKFNSKSCSNPCTLERR